MPTEIDPNTLQYVNHDAQRKAKELEAIMAAAQAQNESSTVDQPVNNLDPMQNQSVDPDEVSAPEPALQVPEATNGPSTEEWEAMLAENATWKKRHADATRALTPAQQKAARLDKELRERREQEQSVLQELKESFAALVEEVKSIKNPKEPIYNPEDDRELNELDPVMADRFRKMNRATQATIDEMRHKHEQELAAIRQQEQARVQNYEVEQDSLLQQKWNNAFGSMIPDYADFLPEGKHGVGLLDYAHKTAPEYEKAILNPYAFSPHFVANVIKSFKATMAPQVNGRKPSLGDLANPQLTGTAPLRQTSAEPEVLCTEYEMQNVRKIHEDLCRKKNMAAAEDLLNRYQRTLLKRNNPKG